MAVVKRWIPVLLMAGVGLAGCGPTLAGSAAVVGEQRLMESQLAENSSQLACVCSASHGQPPGERSRSMTATRSSRRDPAVTAAVAAIG